MAKTRCFGWRPDLPDQRDYPYQAPRKVKGALPTKVDLRSKCPPVVDQLDLGSCTGNAIASHHRFNQMKQGVKTHFMPSRLFIYYNERVMEGTVNIDAGAEIRDGFKTLAKEGAPPETLWPYKVSKFRTRPPKNAYTEALKHQSLTYYRINNTRLNDLKTCLADGYPFVYGFTVYESFESTAVTKGGVAPMPTAREAILGGHAVMAVGYDDKTKRFITLNSWGTGWGSKGYFTIPYDYLTNSNLADDFWTIRLVEV